MSGTVQEGFNAEAARTAFANADKEIQELLTKYQETHQIVTEQLNGQGGTDAALGGNLGTVAQNSFEEVSGTAFELLKTNLANFMQNRVETIIKNSVSLEDEARNTYTTQ